jgi:hypothetical protein
MEHHELDIYQFKHLSAQPGLIHGIFGRAGGCSPPPWDSLNVGADTGDAPERIQRNYERICAALGVRCEDIVTVRQVHSGQVQRVGAGDRGSVVGQLDGLITDEPDVVLSLRFADCVPLIVYDPQRGALGVAHAGWRGTLAKMAAQLVAAMQAAFGSRPADLLAGIGPSIGPCCYQVGPEVAAAASAAFAAETEREDGWPLVFAVDGARYLDLWAANRLQLELAGVEQIETARLCTACHRQRFFSHRGDGGQTGRFAMLAALRP